MVDDIINWLRDLAPHIALVAAEVGFRAPKSPAPCSALALPCSTLVPSGIDLVTI